MVKLGKMHTSVRVCMHYCSLRNKGLQHKARRSARPQHNRVWPHNTRENGSDGKKTAQTTETSHNSLNLIAVSSIKTLISGFIISTWKPQKCSTFSDDIFCFYNSKRKCSTSCWTISRALTRKQQKTDVVFEGNVKKVYTWRAIWLRVWRRVFALGWL